MKIWWYLLATVLGLIGVILVGDADAARLHKERVYQEAWCVEENPLLKGKNPKSEFTLSDRSRVDCLADDFAYEADFADKWAEAIGQSLFYAAMTGKKAGIILIVEDLDRDTKYITRLRDTLIKNCIHMRIIYVNPVFLIDKSGYFDKLNP